MENSRLALWVTQARHRVSHHHLPPLEIANSDSHISTAPATVLPISITNKKPSPRPSGVGVGGLHERRFLSLLAILRFRIILYWNQMSISVSFFDWKMLPPATARFIRRPWTANLRGRTRRQLPFGQDGPPG